MRTLQIFEKLFSMKIEQRIVKNPFSFGSFKMIFKNGSKYQNLH